VTLGLSLEVRAGIKVRPALTLFRGVMMAKLTISYSDLHTLTSEFLGLGSTASDATKAIVARGYRQFLYPIDMATGQLHVWSFVKQFHTFSTVSGQWKYSLPNDFSDFLDVPHFDDETGYNELTKIAPEQILEIRSGSVSSGFSTHFALAPFVYDNEIGTMYEMWVDPVPDGVYLLKFFYRIDPLAPSVAADLLVGGVRATEAIVESCLAVAEQQEDEVIGLHTQLANDLIQKLIRTDIQDTTDLLGNLSLPKPSGYRWGTMVDTDTVYETENGVG